MRASDPRATASGTASPLRIALVCNTAWAIYTYRHGLLRALTGAGARVTVIAPRDRTFEPLAAMGCTCIDLPLASKSTNPLNDLRTLVALYRHYRARAPHVVFHYTIKPNIYGSVAAWLARVPSVAVTTGLGYVFIQPGRAARIAKRLYRFALRFPREVWFLNRDDQAAFVEQKLLAHPERARLLHGEGVDPAAFAYTPLPQHTADDVRETNTAHATCNAPETGDAPKTHGTPSAEDVREAVNARETNAAHATCNTPETSDAPKTHGPPSAEDVREAGDARETNPAHATCDAHETRNAPGAENAREPRDATETGNTPQTHDAHDARAPATPPPFVFLLIGRLLWDKGVGEYVEAARRLRARYPHARFRLLGPVGVDNPSALTRADVAAWEREGLIDYAGETQDVRPFIAAADCVVLPSYREGVPRTLMEACAMGRPVVATDVPGCREVVAHGENGLLCAARDAASLADALAQMLDSSADARRAMGARGRQKVLAEFDERTVVARYRTLIRDLTGLTF